MRKIENRETSPENLANIKEHLFLVRSEALRAESITDRLLILSRPSGRAPSLIDLGETVSETGSLLRYRAGQSGIEFLERSNGEAPRVEGDEPGLRRILLNLLLNALEAIEGERRIQAAVHPVEGGVEISVEDSGRGIACENLKKVFDPFYSKRRGERGTGLGLFIASSSVDQMGGRIGVEGRLGAGTEFSVFLPAA